MVQIEFSAPDDDRPAAEPDRTKRPGGWATAGRFGPAVLWAAAAGCALAAPFRSIYTERIHEPRADEIRETLDGWGRFTVHPAVGDLIQHEPRYGALFCVGAGLFAVLALSTLPAAIVARRRGRTALQAVGIAAGSLVAGVTGTVALVVQSTNDTARAEVAAFRNEAPPSALGSFRIDVDAGGALWLGVAAVGCAVLAGCWLALLPIPAPPRPRKVVPLPALQPGDEVLR